jgi:hypothetical protein
MNLCLRPIQFVLDIEFLHGAMSEVEAEHALLCTDASLKLTMTHPTQHLSFKHNSII